MAGSSSRTASKKASAKPDGQAPKKRGVKGNFTGLRLQILEDHLKPYQDVSKKGPPTVHKWFTLTFFPHYWNTFHWSIPTEVDSIVGPLLPQKDEDLTVEQRELKKTLMDSGTQKIKSWFNYRRNTLGLNSGKDPWTPLLDQIKVLGDPPPRKPSESQFYMQHPDFKSKLDDVFEVKWKAAGLPETHRMAYRCEVAQALFDDEDNDVKLRLRTELEASHARNLEDYNKGLWVADTTDPEKRAEAIASISPVLQPLLDGIRAMTGLYCGFFAAAAPPNGGMEDVQCVCLTSGKSTTGQELSEVDPKGFTQATRLFVRSVAIASGHTDPRLQTNGAPTATPRTGRVYTGNQGSNTPLPPLRVSLATPPPPVPAPAPRAPSSSTSASFRRDAVDLARASLQDIEFEIGDALIESVAKLPPTKKKARIAELKAMGKLELERANNIANNRALMISLGIKDASSMFNAPPRPLSVEPSGDEADYAPSTSKSKTSRKSSAKEPAGGEKGGRLTRGRAKNAPSTIPSNVDCEDGMDVDNVDPANEISDGPTQLEGVREVDEEKADEDEDEEEDKEENEEEDEEEEDEADDESANGNKRDQNTDEGHNLDGEGHFVEGEDSGGAEDVEGDWPDWFTRAVGTFSSVDEDDYGPTWTKMITHWSELEMAAKFEPKPEGPLLTTKDRPYEVFYWIKSKRPYERLPAIPKHEAFGEMWWKWWININPSWRHTKGGTSLKRGRQGEWEGHLPVTGLNGLLSVIAGLWFWREATPSTSKALMKWRAAVADVEWTLQQLLLSNASAGDDGLEEPRSKRMRRANKE